MGWLDKFVKVESEEALVEEVVATVPENQVPVQVEIASAANVVDEIFA